MRVLIAEDDPNILQGLSEVLSNEGYTTVAARDGEQAMAAFAQEQVDFVVLDIMMPKRSGYDVCREIRKSSAVPVLFLSAKNEEIDKVLALELGADDFVSKPFGVRELTARIRAISRRCLATRAQVPAFRLGDLEVEPTKLRARRDDEIIELSLRETKLLALFHERRGEALDRDALFNRGWGPEHYPNSRTLDQAIAQLRKKIERDPKAPVIIRTVHGVGYRVE